MKYYDKERSLLAKLCIKLNVSKAIKSGDEMQKKGIRKNIAFFCMRYKEELSEESVIMLSPIRSLEDIASFLEDKRAKDFEDIFARNEAWKQVSQDFCETKRRALNYLSSVNIMDLSFSNICDDAELIIASFRSFKIILKFKNACFKYSFNSNISISNWEIEKINGSYEIKFVQRYNEFKEVCSGFTFSSIEADVVLYDYSIDNMAPFDIFGPFLEVREQLFNLKLKHDVLGLDYLNIKEKELLFLVGFKPISRMIANSYSIDSKESIDAFIGICNFVKSRRIESLAIRYRDCKSSRKERYFRALVMHLEKHYAEPIYRHINEEIRSANREYLKFDFLGLNNYISNVSRNEVSAIMRSNGFSGEYPSFKKLSRQNGFKTANMNGEISFLLNQKNMASFVSFVEKPVNGGSLMNALAGSIFLDKKKLGAFETLDARSAFFSENCKRRGVYISVPIVSNDAMKIMEQNVVTANTALKYSLCMLPKKRECAGIAVSYAFGNKGLLQTIMSSAMLSALLCGSFFGLISTLGDHFAILSSESILGILNYTWTELYLFVLAAFVLFKLTLGAICSRKFF